MESSVLARVAQPAPKIRQYSDLAARTPPRLAELTLIRCITLVCFFAYLGYLTLKWEILREYLAKDFIFPVWTTVSIWLFVITLAGLVVAAIINTRMGYVVALTGSAVAYSQFPLIQMMELFDRGNSPVGNLHLADFGGIPTCLLVTVFPNVYCYIFCLLSTCMMVALSDGYLPFWHYDDFNGAFYSTLICGPALFIAYNGIRVCRAADQAVFQEYQATTAVLRSRYLAELEAYFIHHINDKVLSTLNAAAAGLIPISDVTKADITNDTNVGTIPVENFIASLQDSVDESTRVIINRTADASTPLPLKTAISLVDAIGEAHHNSVRYAPNAHRELMINWDGTIMSVVFRDTGPGFRVDKVSRKHTGVNIIMTDRPQIYDGVTVNLTSSPEQGTRYEVTWVTDHSARSPGVADKQDTYVPSDAELLGINKLFRMRWVIVMLAAFAFDTIQYDHTGQWHILLTGTGFLAGGLWALTDSSQVQLPWRNTIILVACVSALIFVGQLSHYPRPIRDQHFSWFLSYALLVTMYLALRLRPGVAWSMWLGFAAITYVVDSLLGFYLVAPASMFLRCIPLLIPATLVPLQAKWVVRLLPALRRVNRNEHLQWETALAQQQYTAEMTEWLRSLLQLVDDPTTAKLMEVRIRDAIRSPLLDVPELTMAVWRARASGTQVTLIDSRSPADPDPEEHQRIIADAVEKLAGCPDRVTIRLLPAGRDRYATLVAR